MEDHRCVQQLMVHIHHLVPIHRFQTKQEYHAANRTGQKSFVLLH